MYFLLMREQYADRSLLIHRKQYSPNMLGINTAIWLLVHMLENGLVPTGRSTAPCGEMLTGNRVPGWRVMEKGHVWVQMHERLLRLAETRLSVNKGNLLLWLCYTDVLDWTRREAKGRYTIR